MPRHRLTAVPAKVTTQAFGGTLASAPIGRGPCGKKAAYHDPTRIAKGPAGVPREGLPTGGVLGRPRLARRATGSMTSDPAAARGAAMPFLATPLGLRPPSV